MTHSIPLAIALATLSIAACTPVAPLVRAEGPAAEQSPETLRELLEAHNKERAAEKLPPLTINPKLEAAARGHAADMAEHDKMSHEGSDDSKPAERVERQGYHYQATAENVAKGQKTVAEVMKGWMESPGHRKNILGDSSEMGGAVVKSKDGTPYWCVNFGKPWPKLDPTKAAEQTIAAINREREKAELPPLKLNPILEKAAARHARDTAASGRFEAKDSDGRTPYERVEEAGYRFEKISELAAAGEPTPDEAVKGWLSRDREKKSLLGEAVDVGVGYATSEKGVPYWCLLLAKPAP